MTEKLPPEPYRIKMVEPVVLPTEKERREPPGLRFSFEPVAAGAAVLE